MVSKAPEEHRSFQRDKQLSANQDAYTKPQMLASTGLLLCGLVHWNARDDREEAERIRGSSLAFTVISSF